MPSSAPTIFLSAVALRSLTFHLFVRLSSNLPKGKLTLRNIKGILLEVYLGGVAHTATIAYTPVVS
jgi:hypothetical protein